MEGLLSAARAGNLQEVCRHIKNGAELSQIDPNGAHPPRNLSKPKLGCPGWTPLHHAASQKFQVIVELLLDRSAQVDKQDEVQPPQHTMHCTMHRAQYRGRDSVTAPHRTPSTQSHQTRTSRLRQLLIAAQQPAQCRFVERDQQTVQKQCSEGSRLIIPLCTAHTTTVHCSYYHCALLILCTAARTTARVC